MKKLITFAVISLLATPAFADKAWPEGADSKDNILNAEQSSYVGTGMAAEARQEKIYGSLVGPDNADGFKQGRASERGMGDQYGSVLHDVGTPF